MWCLNGRFELEDWNDDCGKDIEIIMRVRHKEFSDSFRVYNLHICFEFLNELNERLIWILVLIYRYSIAIKIVIK